VVFGAVPIVAGLDKFHGLLAGWEAYLGPLALAPGRACASALALPVLRVARPGSRPRHSAPLSSGARPRA
jgi:hypothetical protein